MTARQLPDRSVHAAVVVVVVVVGAGVGAGVGTVGSHPAVSRHLSARG